MVAKIMRYFSRKIKHGILMYVK